MALFDDLTESLWPNALIGVGAVLLAPVIVPAIAGGLRPVVKTLVKGGIMITDKVNSMVAEAGEQLDDLVAEVRAEMAEIVPAGEAAGEGAEKRTRRK
jgi:Protein of unknown function (DUF5132)